MVTSAEIKSHTLNGLIHPGAPILLNKGCKVVMILVSHSFIKRNFPLLFTPRCSRYRKGKVIGLILYVYLLSFGIVASLAPFKSHRGGFIFF